MPSQNVIRIFRLALLLGAASLAFTGCKIEQKSAASAQKTTAKAGSFENKSFNPEAEVEAMWSTKVLPAIDKMAVDFSVLKKEMSASMDAAGASHGHREKGEGAPWNLAVRLSGVVIDAETELSAGTADVDVDGDGKADAQLQIGPVIRGTTIRDVLPFISFTSYTNQIDFAQLANALNDRGYATTLKTTDRTKLKGQKVEVVGVFTTDNATDIPVLTVTSFKVLGK